MEVLNLWVAGVPRPRPSADAMPIHGGRGAMVYYRYEEYLKEKDSMGKRVRKPWDAGRWREAIIAAADRAWTIYSPCSRNVTKGAGRLKDPLKGPLFASVDFFFPRNQEMLEHPFKYGRDAFKKITRPDSTNLWKLAEDAITEAGIWVDDSQVDFQVQRWYSAIGGAPGMRLVLESEIQTETLFAASLESK